MKANAKMKIFFRAFIFLFVALFFICSPSLISAAECTSIWDCSPWSICSEDKQTRVCTVLTTCGANDIMPLEEMNCTEHVFSLSLSLTNLIFENENFSFDVAIREESHENIESEIKYYIFTEEGYKIFSDSERKNIEGNISFTKLMDNLALEDGRYAFQIEVLYGNLQRVYAIQNFKVSKGTLKMGPEEIKIITETKLDYSFIIMILGLILIVLIALLIVVYRNQTPKRKGTEIISEKLKEAEELLMKGNIDGAKKVYKDIKFLYHISDGKSDPDIYKKVMKFYEKINKKK